MKFKIGVNLNHVTECNKEIARLHNDLAQKIWTGYIKVPIHIYVEHDIVFDLARRKRRVMIEVVTSKYGNFSSGDIKVLTTFVPLRDVVKVMRILKKKFGPIKPDPLF